MFDVLQETHTFWAWWIRLDDQELWNLYENITHDIEIFLQLCETCWDKQKGVIVKPLIFFEFNLCFQINSIDFQSHLDSAYKFMLLYSAYKFMLLYWDNFTKFVILRALRYEGADWVAYNLVDIFTLIRMLSSLQFDSGKEFAYKIVSSLKNYWPQRTTTHSKPWALLRGLTLMLMSWMQDERFPWEYGPKIF